MIFRPFSPAWRAWRIAGPVLIFALALLTRLDFVLNAPQLPASFGDQAGYQIAAQAVISGLRLQFPGTFGPAPGLSAEEATALDRDYRQVFWDATARNGILPLLMAPAYLTDDPIRVLQVIQAILFATIPLAMVLVARRVTTPGLAWLAGLLGALYPPLILITGRFLHQGAAALALTWAVACLLCVHQRRVGPWRVVAGYGLLTAVGYILLVTRPLMLLIMVAYPVGRGRGRRIAKWVFLGGLALLILLWSQTVSGYRHHTLGEELLKNSLGISSDNLSVIGYNVGSFLETELWRTDNTFLPGVELPPQQGFMALLAADPLNFLGGILTNAYRFFLQPFNDFAQPYGLDYGGQVVAHQVLLVLAVVGTLASLARPIHGRGRLAWIVLLGVGLLLAIYATTHIESRYRAILTPLQIVLALVGLVWLGRAGWRVWAVLGGVWLLNAALTAPILLAILPATPPASAHVIDTLLEGAGWAVTAGVVVWAASRTSPPNPLSTSGEGEQGARSGPSSPFPHLWGKGRGWGFPHLWGKGSNRRLPGWGFPHWWGKGSNRRLPGWGFPALTLTLGLGIAVLVGGGMAWDPTWRGWTAVIAPGERVQQIITLGDFTPPPGTAPVFLLDLGAPAQEPNLTITVNGQEIKGQWVPLQPWAATRGADELAFSYTFELLRSLSAGYAPDFRRWGFMALDPALWAGADQIVVELVGTGMDPVTLWGDYVDDPAVFVGPSLSPFDDGRSVFRLLWSKDDRRVTVRRDLQGLRYYAQRGIGAGEALRWSEDLSTASGLQTGRYRAYVLWLTPQDSLPYTPP